MDTTSQYMACAPGQFVELVKDVPSHAAGTRLRVVQREQVGDGQRLILVDAQGHQTFVDGDQIQPVAVDELGNQFDRDGLIVIRLEREDGSEVRYSGFMAGRDCAFTITFSRTSSHWDTFIELPRGRVIQESRYSRCDAQQAHEIIYKHVLSMLL